MMALAATWAAVEIDRYALLPWSPHLIAIDHPPCGGHLYSHWIISDKHKVCEMPIRVRPANTHPGSTSPFDRDFSECLVSEGYQAEKWLRNIATRRSLSSTIKTWAWRCMLVFLLVHLDPTESMQPGQATTFSRVPCPILIDGHPKRNMVVGYRSDITCYPCVKIALE